MDMVFGEDPEYETETDDNISIGGSGDSISDTCDTESEDFSA